VAKNRCVNQEFIDVVNSLAERHAEEVPSR